jgi:hypothetical protein
MSESSDPRIVKLNEYVKALEKANDDLRSHNAQLKQVLVQMILSDSYSNSKRSSKRATSFSSKI